MPSADAPVSGAPPDSAATSAVRRCPTLPFATDMACVRVWPAMLDANVPARWFVKIAIEGRAAWAGVTALVPNSRRLDEKVGGMTNSPYTFPVSSNRRASSWETTRTSNLFLSKPEARPSAICPPYGPASSFTTAMGKFRRLVVGFKIPPRYSAHSADIRPSVTTMGSAQNRTVRIALMLWVGLGAAWRGCDLDMRAPDLSCPLYVVSAAQLCVHLPDQQF